MSGEDVKEVLSDVEHMLQYDSMARSLLGRKNYRRLMKSKGVKSYSSRIYDRIKFVK